MPSYKINRDRNGIELYFSRKPPEEIRESLKSCGWRWSAFGKFWYNFNTSANLKFAKEICNLSESLLVDFSRKKSLSSNTSRSKSTTQRTERKSISKGDSVIKGQKYRKNDCVLIQTDDKTYSGIVEEFNEKKDLVVVLYCESEYDCAFAKEVMHRGSFNADNVKVIKRRFPKSIRVGSIVRYVARNNTIRLGTVVGYEDDAIDIAYYFVDEYGEIDYEIEYGLNMIRVIEDSESNFLPVSLGDKVEFESRFADVTVGTICKIEYLSIYVKYRYVNRWGDKEIDRQCVSFRNVRVMGGGRKPVDRSQFISEDNQKDIDNNERIKKRIKNRRDIFVEATSFVNNDSLYRHQRAGAVLAKKYDKFAFFYDTGTGKTVMALDIIRAKEKSEDAKFLIIAPKSIIKTAWMDDAAKYYPELRILPLYNGFGQKKQRLLYEQWHSESNTAWKTEPKFLAYAQLLFDIFELGKVEIENDSFIQDNLFKEAHHYIVNSEMFIRNPDKYINDYNISGIIMDESAILKNYNGKTSKTMRAVSSKLKYVYLLSGKPAPNNIIEYFSQMKIVDPETFEMNYETFLNTFCYMRNRKYEMIPENEKIFAEMVSIKSLIVSKKDCLDLPDTVDVVRQIELSDSVMHDYNLLYAECMAIIKGMDDSEVYYSSKSKLAVLMKLRQMASGFFLIEKEGNTEEKIILEIHNSKLEELNNILDQIEEEQVIIWCQFHHEIELIEEELSKRAYTVTAYGKSKNLEKNIDDFKTGKAQYIIAHPKTLKYGVTFVNCKYTVYYSFSYSAEDYDQSHDRNYRLGQKEKCTYLYIQAADTIDEIMYKKVKEKLSDADFFEMLIKDAANHGIDYSNLKKNVDTYDIKDGKSNKEIIDDISDKIFKSQSRYSQSHSGYIHEQEVKTTLDYLDKIKEPSADELRLIDCYFTGRDYRLFKRGEIFEQYLFDFTRPDYFDYVHANEQVLEYGSDMSAEDFIIFIRGHKSDRWMYEVYWAIDTRLKKMDLFSAEVIRCRYGLMSGKKQTLKSVARAMHFKYGDADEYMWNTARVSYELKEAVNDMRTIFPELEEYALKIKEML